MTSHIPTCSFWSCARIFNDSRQSSVSVAKKEMSGYRISSRCSSQLYQTIQYVDISFFSLSLYIYTRYDCDTEPTYNFWEDLILHILFQEYIKLCKHCCFLQLYFYLYRCCFNNCASWCAWFFFSASL